MTRAGRTHLPPTCRARCWLAGRPSMVPLIESWETLRAWLEEDREALVLQERVARAAWLWKEAGSSPDYLWEGGRLEHVLELKENERLAADELG